MQFKELRKIAEKFYSKGLPYHNFDHAITTIRNAKKIVENCKKDELYPDEEIICISLLFHDAGYHQDHKEKGHYSKEDYSAVIAEEILRKEGFEETKIQKIKRAIITTHRYARWRTLEEGIIRAADLAGMAADYQTFLKNTILLKEEYELLNNRKLTLNKYKQIVKKIIGFYLKEDIHLSRKYFDDDGKSHFHTKTIENLSRFLKESSSNHASNHNNL